VTRLPGLSQLCPLYWKLGRLLPRTGRFDEAVDVLQRAVSTAAELRTGAPKNPAYRYLLANSR
jgi:hypothetical protein